MPVGMGWSRRAVMTFRPVVSGPRSVPRVPPVASRAGRSASGRCCCCSGPRRVEGPLRPGQLVPDRLVGGQARPLQRGQESMVPSAQVFNLATQRVVSRFGTHRCSPGLKMEVRSRRKSTLPQPHRPVAACGGEGRAVGAEGHGPHRALVPLEGGAGLARRRVPGLNPTMTLVAKSSRSSRAAVVPF